MWSPGRASGFPRLIDARAQFCAESLSGLSGEEFDRCYAKAQLVMHMDAVAAFEAEAHRGQDPDIKAVAALALPIIKDHLDDDQADRDAVREGEDRGSERDQSGPHREQSLTVHVSKPQGRGQAALRCCERSTPLEDDLRPRSASA